MADHCLRQVSHHQARQQSGGQVQSSRERQLWQSQRELLKGARWILLKTPANHNPKQAASYAGLLKSNLAKVNAHQMRLILREIYALADAGVARRKLRALCRWVRRVADKHHLPLCAAMVKAGAMIEQRINGVVALWIHHPTHAFMQGLKSVCSVIKSKAVGLRSTDNFIAMLYFTVAHLDIPATH